MTENSLDHFEIGSIILQLEWLKRYYIPSWYILRSHLVLSDCWINRRLSHWVNLRRVEWIRGRLGERHRDQWSGRHTTQTSGGSDAAQAVKICFGSKKKAASWEMFLGDSPSWLVFSEFEKNHQGSWTFKQFPSISKLALHCNSVFHTRTLYSLAPACYPTHQGQTDQTTSTDGGFWWSSWSTSISSQCLKYILWFHFIG